MEMQPTTVSNFDVATMVDRTTIYAREVFYSASASNGSVYLEQDLIRHRTYVENLQTVLDRIRATPMDLPKVHGEGFSLLMDFPLDEDIVKVENQYVKEVLRRLQALWYELTNSQSADQTSGINEFDSIRIEAILNAISSILNDAAEPLDLPENIGNRPVPEGRASSSTRGRSVRTLRS
jgi:hypothetical protein